MVKDPLSLYKRLHDILLKNELGKVLLKKISLNTGFFKNNLKLMMHFETEINNLFFQKLPTHLHLGANTFYFYLHNH